MSGDLFYSDRDCPICVIVFSIFLKRYDIDQSMSKIRNPWNSISIGGFYMPLNWSISTLIEVLSNVVFHTL